MRLVGVSPCSKEATRPIDGMFNKNWIVCYHDFVSLWSQVQPVVVRQIFCISCEAKVVRYSTWKIWPIIADLYWVESPESASHHKNGLSHLCIVSSVKWIWNSRFMWNRNRPKSESSIYRPRSLKTSSHQVRLPYLVSARSVHSTSFNAIDTSRSRLKTPQNSWSDWPSDMENNKLQNGLPSFTIIIG